MGMPLQRTLDDETPVGAHGRSPLLFRRITSWEKPVVYDFVPRLCVGTRKAALHFAIRRFS
jgi:hypothetical protein